MLRLFTSGSSNWSPQDRLQQWTLEEMAIFDAALAQHGKDFSQVAQNVSQTKYPDHWRWIPEILCSRFSRPTWPDQLGTSIWLKDDQRLATARYC